MRKTGLYGYVFDFLFDYDSIDVDDILDIHEYLMFYVLLNVTKNILYLRQNEHRIKAYYEMLMAELWIWLFLLRAAFLYETDFIVKICQTMTAITNIENLQQYKSKFFHCTINITSSTNLIREVNITMFYIAKNSDLKL